MKTSKRSAFNIFTSVVFALFLREVQTRFGTQKMGYFWAIVDPMTKLIIFAGLKAAIAERGMPGIDYPVFLATGILTYGFFDATMRNGMMAFDANRALFSYRQVKPIDTIVSRFILEFLIMVITILVFAVFGLYVGWDMQIKNINMVFLAIAWLGIFGFGIGVLFAIIGTFYETFKKIIGFLSMPMFMLSGAIISVDSLPPFARELILYNPVLHFIEMIHGNYFAVLDTKYVNYEYMLFWTLIPLFLGLYFYKNSEKKIIAS